MEVKELEIMCIYRSRQGREVDLARIKDGSDTLDYEDLSLPNFLSIMGGISITINGFMTIYRGMNFYTILTPVSFLLDSLYWINGRTTGFLDLDSNYPSSLIINTMINEKLILSINENSKLSLSFVAPNKNQDKKRGFYYFEHISICRQKWTEAVCLALKEYFNISEEILKQNPKGQNIQVLRDFLNLWQDIYTLNPKDSAS